MMPRHSGAERSEEPGIHTPGVCGYGFRARRFAAPRNDALWLAALLLSFLAFTPAHAADDVANFYRGKQIRFIVGSAPGGTYDLLARIVARHIGAHIPGIAEHHRAEPADRRRAAHGQSALHARAE